MFKLKNGTVIEYDKDIDKFFYNLLNQIIEQSKKETDNLKDSNLSPEKKNDIFLKDIMDNCILVTHQLYEISKENEELGKFLTSGFIFNSIIQSISQNGILKDLSSQDDDDKTNIIH